jgi:hypothetical protein
MMPSFSIYVAVLGQRREVLASAREAARECARAEDVAPQPAELEGKVEGLGQREMADVIDEQVRGAPGP